MPWKTITIGEGDDAKEVIAIDEKTKNPIFLRDNGVETPINAEEFFSKIQVKINDERKLKEEKKVLEAQIAQIKEDLEKFKDIDPEKYLEMTEQLKNIEGKKLIEAGEVEKLRAEEKDAVTKEWKKKYDKDIKDLMSKLEQHNNLTAEQESMIKELGISNFFAHSKFVRDEMTYPPEHVESIFGRNFSVERDPDTGKIRITGYRGKDPIRSSKDPGEIADPDDALRQLVYEDPSKELMLKGDNQSGGGSGDDDKGGGGKGGLQYKTLEGLTIQQKNELITKDPEQFKKLQRQDLLRQREARKKLQSPGA